MIPIAGPYEFHPGWIACCGDALRLDQQAGLTALNGAKRFGKNVICGHTHRLGKISYSEGYEQNITRTLTGVEVGHLSDRRHVESSNSQQGIAIGEVVDGELIVTPIPARRKGFRLPGQLAI
ncbi:hypothetical protein SAMN05216377_11284 [Pseudonocardia oroxyli]|uniref:Calcineurin-like phosphoesterase superfamily domain-containing protein n=2 Tax=Pseudonocardia oroxyli TaxID=366584 RepID=A0A1G7UMR4_PSEOR|nr:hypothetical protein SAMN05216377_11284 [Pseudonocardia oroxyli]